MGTVVVEGLDIAQLATALAGVDVSVFGDDELAGLVVDTERLLNAAHALSAVALEEFERRGTWAGDGASSAAGWAAGRTGTATRTLRARVRAGAGLRLLPAAAPAARWGGLSPQHLTALAGCARRHPGLAARDETVLVRQAEALDADGFGVVARQWEQHAVDVDSADPAAVSSEEPVDELHVSRTFDGRYQLNGTFSPHTGELVRVALDAHVDRHLRAARDGDPSAPTIASQVRAAALVDLIAQTMRREPGEGSTPDRYRVAVVVRADTAGLPLAACDSPAFRVVLGARSDVLDVGRLTQTWPPAIRRAITLRDGGCVFPGCDRPPSWCDVHHCRPWDHGGTTSTANGALLCRRHHTFIHQHHWTTTVEAGTPITRRTDGTPHHTTRWDTTPPPTSPSRESAGDCRISGVTDAGRSVISVGCGLRT